MPALAQVEGQIVVREHCTFRWVQREGAYHRVVVVLPSHCRACIDELADRFALVYERRHPARTAEGSPPPRIPRATPRPVG